MPAGQSTSTHRWHALGEVYIASPPAPSPRSFGFTVGGVILAIAAFSLWRRHIVRAEVAAAAGALLVAAALIRPAALTSLARGWGHVGHALGWFNSRVLLTLLFVIILWPIGVVSRLFGSDPLGRRRAGGSLWLAYSTRIRDRRHYERMF
jgi:hypothetical protein